MKYSLAVMLLLGLVTQTEGARLYQESSMNLMAKPKESAAIQLTHKKADAPKKNDTKSLTKVAQKVSPVNVKKIELKKVAQKESKPPKDNAKI